MDGYKKGNIITNGIGEYKIIKVNKDGEVRIKAIKSGVKLKRWWEPEFLLKSGYTIKEET